MKIEHCSNNRVAIYLGSIEQPWKNSVPRRVTRRGLLSAIQAFRAVTQNFKIPLRLTKTYFVGTCTNEPGWEIAADQLPVWDSTAGDIEPMGQLAQYLC